MSWRVALRMWIRALLQRDALERQLDEELRLHLELQAAENLRRGMAPAEARRQAHLAFGGVEAQKDACRDARGVGQRDALAADFRHARQGLRRSPSLGLAIVTLGIAIGVNGALFALLNAHLLRMPAGVPKTDRLVWVSNTGPLQRVSLPDFRDLARSLPPAFAGLGAYQSVHLSLASAGEPTRVRGQLVAGDYFGVLGLSPAAGRLFRVEEGQPPPASTLAVLGHDLWRGRFGGDPSVVGSRIDLGGRAFTVVGVAPKGFAGIDVQHAAEIWVPADTLGRGAAVSRANPSLRLVGRLAGSADASTAQAQLQEVAIGLAAYGSERLFPLLPTVSRLRGPVALADVRSALPLLMLVSAMTGLVLLTAWSNAATVLLARITARRREIGIRVALGAGRARLVRLLLAESVLLVVPAGVLGLGVALAGAAWLSAQLGGFPAGSDLSPDVRTLAFVLSLAGTTALVLTMMPAWHIRRLDGGRAFRGDDTRWAGRSRAQRTLLAAQVAFTLVVLTCAALLARRAAAARTVDPGFRTEGVLTLSVDLHAQGYPERSRLRFHSDLAAAVRALPGVHSAASPAFAPFSGTVTYARAELPGRVSEEVHFTAVLRTDPAVFRTLGIPVLHGRALNESDVRERRRVAVVSQSFARRHWPAEEAVGRRFRVPLSGADPLQVVGVAADVSFEDIHRRRDPHVYLPHTLVPPPPVEYVLVRTEGDPEALVEHILVEVHRLDASLPVFDIRTMAGTVEREARIQAGVAGLATTLGLLVLLIAILGLYGVTAFAVAGRSREIALRMALGADGTAVVHAFVRDGLRLIAVGLLAGSVPALMLSRALASIAAGIPPSDPRVLVGVGLLIACISLLFLWVPARGAASVDPAAILRTD